MQKLALKQNRVQGYLVDGWIGDEGRSFGSEGRASDGEVVVA